MPLFTSFITTDARPMPESNILGATGLSRATLAAMFRSNGLFGSDSALSSSEQEVVLACLRIPGRLPSSVMPETTSRLEALKHMTRLLLRTGRIASAAAESRLASAGFDSGALHELCRVVMIARDVFGVGASLPRIDGSADLDAIPAWKQDATVS